MSEQVTPRPLTNEEKELLCREWEGAPDGFEVLEHVDNGSTRWHSQRMVVFRMEGSKDLFGLEYEKGLTESQEGDYPGLYESNHDEFQPVRVAAKAVTRTVYEVQR